jgi:hypothetical protein
MKTKMIVERKKITCILFRDLLTLAIESVSGENYKDALAEIEKNHCKYCVLSVLNTSIPCEVVR